MFAMVLDHIHYMFEYTGKVPEWFSVVGRLAAPIFLFCLIEGFEKTRNQKKYFMNIYLISIVMGAIRFGFYNVLNIMSKIIFNTCNTHIQSLNVFLSNRYYNIDIKLFLRILHNSSTTVLARVEPRSPTLQADSLPSEPPAKPF